MDYLINIAKLNVLFIFIPLMVDGLCVRFIDQGCQFRMLSAQMFWPSLEQHREIVHRRGARILRAECDHLTVFAGDPEKQVIACEVMRHLTHELRIGLGGLNVLGGHGRHQRMILGSTSGQPSSTPTSFARSSLMYLRYSKLGLRMTVARMNT